MFREFQTELDGFSIAGTVEKPDNQELSDYYVRAKLGSFTYSFTMIMVSTPPRYSVNLVECHWSDRKDVDAARLYIRVSRDVAENIFSAALGHCLRHYRAVHKERSK